MPPLVTRFATLANRCDHDTFFRHLFAQLRPFNKSPFANIQWTHLGLLAMTDDANRGCVLLRIPSHDVFSTRQNGERDDEQPPVKHHGTRELNLAGIYLMAFMPPENLTKYLGCGLTHRWKMRSAGTRACSTSAWGLLLKLLMQVTSAGRTKISWSMDLAGKHDTAFNSGRTKNFQQLGLQLSCCSKLIQMNMVHPLPQHDTGHVQLCPQPTYP